MTREPRPFPGASLDHWLTTDPREAELGPSLDEVEEMESAPPSVLEKIYEAIDDQRLEIERIANEVHELKARLADLFIVSAGGRK